MIKIWQNVMRVIDSKLASCYYDVSIIPYWTYEVQIVVRVAIWRGNQVQVLSDPVTVNMEWCRGYAIARKAWEGVAERWYVSQETCWKSMNSFRRKRFHRTTCKSLGQTGMFWGYEMSAFYGWTFLFLWWKGMHKCRVWSSLSDIMGLRHHSI